MSSRFLLAKLGGVLVACLLGVMPTADAGNGYGYGYSYSYYPSYQTYYPSYQTYTPQYTYYSEYRGARYWPAGDYYYLNGIWYLKGVGPYYGQEYPAAASYTAPAAAPAYSADWRSKLLDVAKSRDDLVAYQQALDKLGLSGTNGVLQGSPGYPGVQAYGHGYATPVLGPYGAQAATTYGYSVKQIQESYGGMDVNVGLQQAARLAASAQDNGRTSIADLMALVKVGADNNSRVAETFARGMAIAATIQAAGQATAAAPSTRTTTVMQSNGVGTAPAPAPMDPPADPQGPAPRAVTQQSQAFLTAVAIPQCGSCHGADSKRKFKVGMLTQQLDGEERALLLERIHSIDPEQGMPRDATGKHAPLTKEQKRLWLKFLVQ